METKKIKAKKVKKKKSDLTPFAVIGLVGMIILFVGGLLVTIGRWTYFDLTNYSSSSNGASHTEMLVGYLIMDIGMFLIMLMGFVAPFSRKVLQEDKKFFLVLGIASTFIFVFITKGLLL